MIKYRIYYTLWAYWHMWLRHYYDKWFNHGEYTWQCRPWYHMCCNGDNGGWRTHLCNHLEYKWRALEERYDERYE